MRDRRDTLRGKIPTKEDVLVFIRSCSVPPKKRDIATALNIKGTAARAALKEILAHLKAEDLYRPTKTNKIVQGLFQIERLTRDGDARAHLIKMITPGRDTRDYPLIFEVVPSSLFPNITYLDIGDRFYGEIVGPKQVSPIRMLREETAEELLLGVIIRKGPTYWFHPCDRHHKGLYAIHGDSHTIEKALHHYVSARLDLQQHGVVTLVQDLGGIEAVADMVTLRYHLPHAFSETALALTKPMTVPPLGKRRDVRNIPLVTIDGHYSRDFDDAVWAEPDVDPQNKDGWHIMVAIADVAHYVRPGDALDTEAYLRGNSVYFPNKVLPMLPERLSNDLCSLRPQEDRACLGVDIRINAKGQLLSHNFFKGLMCSSARLTYDEVERVLDGEANVLSPDIHESVARLGGAYQALLIARSKREPLSIHMPEVSMEFDANGEIISMGNSPSLKSHQLIEEFMVLANRAAAQVMEKNKLPGIYRTHAAPTPEKIKEFKDFLKAQGIRNISSFQTPEDFNHLVASIENVAERDILYDMILRTQSKAIYAPHNGGHFGLNLKDYCHFTSPIRRYADLVVHRALGDWIDQTQERTTVASLSETCTHISERERYAMSAEREVTDRLAAFYFLTHIDEEMEGYISGIGGAGLFVTFEHIQVTGLVPLEALSDDYYIEKKSPLRLEGRRTQRIYKIGQRLKIRIASVDLAKGRVRLGLVGEGGRTPPSRSHPSGQKKRPNLRKKRDTSRRKKVLIPNP